MRTCLVLGLGLLLGACRFDAGGLERASDDASGGDDVAVDASPPGSPDAREASPDAAVPQPTPGVLVAAPAVGPITLDGADAEFTAAGAVPISFAIQDGRLYQVTTASYTPSAHVTLSAIHDDTAIYFFARVVDSVYQVDSTSVWDDDGIALYLDAAGGASGPYAEDDHDLVVRADGDWGDYGPVGTAATVTVATARPSGGYTIEVQVDKDSLSAPIGASMGFDLSLTDDDGWSDSGYDADSAWFTASRPACASCCQNETVNQPYCDTTLYGQLVLE